MNRTIVFFIFDWSYFIFSDTILLANIFLPNILELQMFIELKSNIKINLH